MKNVKCPGLGRERCDHDNDEQAQSPPEGRTGRDIRGLFIDIPLGFVRARLLSAQRYWRCEVHSTVPVFILVGTMIAVRIGAVSPPAVTESPVPTCGPVRRIECGGYNGSHNRPIEERQGLRSIPNEKSRLSVTGFCSSKRLLCLALRCRYDDASGIEPRRSLRRTR